MSRPINESCTLFNNLKTKSLKTLETERARHFKFMTLTNKQNL